MAARDEVRRLLDEGMKQTDIASELSISAGRVSQLAKEIKKERESAGKQPQSSKSKAGGKPRNPPPPGPNKGSFKKDDPRAGAPKANDNATKLGEFRNPLVHVLPAHLRRAVDGLDALPPAERLKHSINNYDARMVDMNLRLAKLMHKRAMYMVTDTKYIRQEGDGELAGTFRQAQRQRIRVDDQVTKMHEAITRVQSKRDASVEKLHKMLQDTEGGRKKGLADVLAAIKADGDGDDD